MERSRESSLCVPSIQVVGLFQRVGVDHDDRVDRRSVLVIRIDAPQVGVDQRMTRQAACLHRVMNLRDGRLLDTEGCSRGWLLLNHSTGGHGGGDQG